MLSRIGLFTLRRNVATNGAPGGRAAVSNTVSSLGEARRGGSACLFGERPEGAGLWYRHRVYMCRGCGTDYHGPAPYGRSRLCDGHCHRASPLRGSTRCYSRPRALRALRGEYRCASEPYGRMRSRSGECCLRIGIYAHKPSGVLRTASASLAISVRLDWNFV